jgi:Domain of unknown function (DUF4349)
LLCPAVVCSVSHGSGIPPPDTRFDNGRALELPANGEFKSTLWRFAPPGAEQEVVRKKAWGEVTSDETRAKKASESGVRVDDFVVRGTDRHESRLGHGGAPMGITNGTAPENQLLRYYANPESEARNKPAKEGEGKFNPNAHWFKETAPVDSLLAEQSPQRVELKDGEVKGDTKTGKPAPESSVRLARGGSITNPALPGFNFNTTATQPADPVKADPPAVGRKVILRSGDIEFEVESFDSAVAAVTKLVTAIDGAFVATVNSEKLPNGKVKGTVAVRVPPDKLDGLVLDLRRDLGKGGELKGQRIGSQDVTKQYTDLESRLKAARTMETRLLAIIKDGKGEIKQLLDAEKELGVWRTKIEEMEGEKRYFDTLAALSTLTITLAEKEIKAAAGVTESECVQTGIEVEDVEQAYRDALAAVTAANGRVTKSDLKQVSAGQFNATLVFEVAPDAAGPVRDRLRQLGRVARLEISRVAAADPGGTVTKEAKVKRGDTQFNVQIYNVANMAPRETTTLAVEADNVDAAGAVLTAAAKEAGGRVVDSGTATDRGSGKMTARYVVDVPLASAAGIAEKAKANGGVKVNEVSRNAAATDGRFATARLSVTFTTPDRIVAPDDGLGPQVQKGLRYSVAALLASLTWLVFGLLVVLPWAAALYVGYRVVRRVAKRP